MPVNQLIWQNGNLNFYGENWQYQNPFLTNHFQDRLKPNQLRSEALAKAIGYQQAMTIFDGTAGLGRETLIMAALGLANKIGCFFYC